MKNFICAFLIYIFVAYIPNAKAQQNFEQVKHRIQQLILEDYLLNASMAYIQPDGEVQHYFFGNISPEINNKPENNTIYEIGSISKTFTSLILARMVEKGIVSLDTPIGAILPDSLKLPTYNGQKITLLHLSTHTSGLPRLPSNIQPVNNPLNPYADYGVQKLYKFMDGYELTRAPGSKVVYSNLGAGLLGHLLALKSGMSYEKLLKHYLTKPLEMDETHINVPESKLNRFAAAYNFGRNVEHWDWLALVGAGGIRSTAKDLVTYLKAQMSLLKTPFDAAIELTHQIQFEINSTRAIGLAWFHSTKQDTIIWHNGETGGFSSFMGWNVENKTGVIILASGTQGVTDIGMHILDNAYEMNELPKIVNVDSTTLTSYAGYYQITPVFGIEIFLKNGGLMARATNQSALRIFPRSKTRFFYKMVDAEIEFVADDDGNISTLKLYQGGRVLTGQKEIGK